MRPFTRPLADAVTSSGGYVFGGGVVATITFTVPGEDEVRAAAIVAIDGAGDWGPSPDRVLDDLYVSTYTDFLDGELIGDEAFMRYHGGAFDAVVRRRWAEVKAILREIVIEAEAAAVMSLAAHEPGALVEAKS